MPNKYVKEVTLQGGKLFVKIGLSINTKMLCFCFRFLFGEAVLMMFGLSDKSKGPYNLEGIPRWYVFRRGEKSRDVLMYVK